MYPREHDDEYHSNTRPYPPSLLPSLQEHSHSITHPGKDDGSNSSVPEFRGDSDSTTTDTTTTDTTTTITTTMSPISKPAVNVDGPSDKIHLLPYSLPPPHPSLADLLNTTSGNAAAAASNTFAFASSLSDKFTDHWRDSTEGEWCWPSDAAELEQEIVNGTCFYVNLGESFNRPSNPYRLANEIIIDRHIVLQGNPLEIPFIDCFDTVRCFRVIAGGYLEMRHVHINQGTGEYRAPIPILEGIPPTGEVLESRGGTVLFEYGALGGNFVGVMFEDDMSGQEEIELIILLNEALVSVRIYGGFVMAVAGRIQFVGCLFYDYEVIATNDRLYIGGDILVLGGELSFIGCTWIYTTWFAGEAGAGFNVAMLGGVSLFTFCQFLEINGFVLTNGVGQAFFVAGGVQILTALDVSSFSIAAQYSGTGDLTVLGGVQVATGVSIEDVYAMMASFGAGLDYCVGGGALIHTGTSVNEFAGPVVNLMVGGYAFLGGGVMSSVGGSVGTYVSTAYEAGAGSVTFVGGGVATFIACPVVDFSAIGCAFFFGEYIFVGKGLLTLLFSPTIVFTAIDFFQGYGGFVFVGLGGALLGFSPTFQRYFITDDTRDFWIMGVCEPEPDVWAAGKPFFVTAGYEGGSRCRQDSDRERMRMMEGGKEVSVVKEEAGEVGATAEDLALAALPSLPTSTPSSPSSPRPPPLGLLSINTTAFKVDYDNDTQLETLKAMGVPPLLIQAAIKIQNALDPLRGGEREGGQGSAATAPQDDDTIFYVNSRTEGYCGVCGSGSDSVGGPGADHCEVEENCGDLNRAPGEYAGMLGWGEEGFEEVEFLPHFILLGEMEMTTREGVSSAPLDHSRRAEEEGKGEGGTEGGIHLKKEGVEAAVRQALLTLIPSIDSGPESLSIGVWESEPDPLFAAMFPSLPPSFFVGQEGFEVTHRHKLAIVTTREEDAEALLLLLQEGGNSLRKRRALVVEEGLSHKEAQEWHADGLSALIKEGVVREEGVEVGHVGVEFEKVWKAPAYNDMKGMGGQDGGKATSFGSLSVVVTDPLLPAVPVTEVMFKHPYVIHLEKFPSSVLVKIELFGIPEEKEEGEEEDEKMWWEGGGGGKVTFRKTLLGGGSVRTNEEGGFDFPYRFLRLMDAAPGEYYVQATVLETGVYGQSLPFSLAAEGRSRKLYGPRLRI